MLRGLRCVLGFLIAMACTVAPMPTLAQDSSSRNRLKVIRDAEIETDICAMAKPIWKAAGLNTKAVRVVLVENHDLNAFVAGGQNIFIYTGLLMTVKTPEQLMGVIAHETGHIAGGHIARSERAMKNASIQQILFTLLGAVAIIAGGGRGDAGMAVITGASSVIKRNLLAFSRTQESSADQAAVTFLNRIHVTGRGLLQFLQVIGNRQAYLRSQVNPYLQTHPLTPERIAALKQRVNHSPYANTRAPAAYDVMLERIQGKLHGFLDDPNATLRRIPPTATRLGDRYARAVALYRASRVDEAVAAVKALLKDNPNDPYFLELEGQTLYDNGRFKDAIAPYAAAVKARPDAPLIRVGLASAMLASNNPKYVDRAIHDLEVATTADPENPMAWYRLAIAYGAKNNIGMASLASAERFMLTGNMNGAYTQAERAHKLLPYGAPSALRAKDILDLSLRLWKKEGGRRNDPD